VSLFGITACGQGDEATSATAQATPAQTAIATLFPAAPAVSDHGAEVATPSITELIQLGHSTYATNCAPCHQLKREGNLNRFPALSGNAFVPLQQPQPLIQTVLYGRGGVMPGFAPTLSEQEITAVLSYIRNAWGNSASLVSAAQVSEVKAATTPTSAQADGEQLITKGEEIYAENCASCHQASGEGTAAYPALTQSELLTAEDPTEAIEIVLHGRGLMPAFEGTLSTEEIAAVLSYERNSWDNNATTTPPW
jgi:cytochrome c oxidase subunit 2